MSRYSGTGIGRAAALSLLLALAGCNGGGGGGDAPATGNTPITGDMATPGGNGTPQTGNDSANGNTGLSPSSAWRPAKPAEQNWPGKVLAGYYECIYHEAKSDGSHVDRASFKFDFYPEGQAYVFNAETHFEDHSYRIDSVNQTLRWTDGTFEIYWNDEPTRYAFLSDGTPVIQLSRDSVYGAENLRCVRTGPAREMSPYQKAIAENDPETGLQPPSVQAPLPPAGAGGLSGLYLTLNGSGHWMYDFNGGSTFIPASTRYYYFMSDGYYYEGLYGWSFDALDCRRMKTDGKPLCGTYLIKDGQIQLDGGAWQGFESSDTSVSINGKAWLKENPPPTTLHGSWSMTNGSSLPNGGGAYYTNSWVLRRDGTFESGFASSLLVNSSPSWADSNTTVTGGGSNSHTGRYSIKDYTLTLEYNDGTVVKKVFWISDKDSDPHAYIYINGSMFYR
ncbi:MAG: hypothetical protein ACRCZ5_05605 [Burkholderiales bacterium]